MIGKWQFFRTDDANLNDRWFGRNGRYRSWEEDMMKIRLALYVMILFLVPGMVCSQVTASGAGRDLPPAFEENGGQQPEDYRFLIRDVGYTLGLAADRLEIRPSGAAAGQNLQLRFSGGNRFPVLSGESLLPGKVHYLVGSDAADWITDLSTYSSARYRSLYEGIDLVVGGRRGALTLDFELAPQEDHDNLVIELQGLDPVELGRNGEVKIGNAIRLSAPEIFQQTAEGPVPVSGMFLLFDGNRIAVEPTERDIDLPMTIRIRLDGNRSPSKRIGSKGQPDLAVAADGDVIVAGRTMPFGAGEAYVTRLTHDQSTVLFTTYFGGSGDDLPSAVAVDASGQVVVVGGTTSGNDFPSVGGAIGFSGGRRDAFIVRISPDGSDLVHSTLLGGQQQDEARDVAIGPDQSVWITGDTEGDFPVGGDAFDPEAGGASDAWLAHLAADGSELLFSSCLGGSGSETGAAVALDDEWNVYVTGTTDSDDFPLLVPLQEEPGSGDQDIFLLKLSSYGEVLYANRIGGPGSEQGKDLEVDGAGSVYVSGWRSGHDYTPGMPATLFEGTARRARRIAVSRRSGAGDAFIAKINPEGTAVVWSSPLGGSGEERGRAIALDDDGKVWIAGATGSVDFPVVDARQPARSGDDDAFLSALSPDGSRLVRSTYMGGTGSDSASAIEKAGRDVLVLGRSSSSELPGAQVIGSDSDGHSVFLARIGSSDASPLAAGCPGTINFDNSSGNGQWHESTNWDTDVLPADTDDVCIDGFAVTLSFGTQSAGTLFVSATGGLDITSQATLSLASPSEINGPFSMDNGSLTGTGALTLNGTFDWLQGGMTISGGVLATGTVNITGRLTPYIQDSTFRNTAVVNWNEGGMTVTGTASIVNDGTWEVTHDPYMSAQNSRTSNFVNNGTFRKTVATETTRIAVIFHNSGTVDVQTGILQLENGGDSTGSFVGPGSMVFDGRTHELLPGSLLSVSQVTVTPGRNGGTTNISGEYDVPGVLSVDTASLTFKSGAVVTNIGDLLADGNIKFETGSPIVLHTVTLTGSSLGGTDALTIDGTFDWSIGGLNVANEILATGTVNMTGAARHTISSGTFRTTGTVNLSGTGMAELTGGGAIVNDGTWEITNDANIFTPNTGSLVFTNNGILRKSISTGETHVSTTFLNFGSVEILAGTLRIRDDYIQTSGATVLNGGSLHAASLAGHPLELDIQGGIIAGVGTITGNMNNRGFMAPGLSAGLLDVDGNYTENAPGGMNIELGGLTAGTEYDRLGVTGTAALSGTLNVTLIDGFVPADGDSFTILNAPTVSGTFATVNTPVLPGGEPWRVTYNPTSVVLTVGATSCVDADNDGFAVCDASCTVSPGDSCGDCDDDDPTIYPGAEELCDGIDNDCNSVVPADELDGDGDGFRTCDGDCDDGESASYPGAEEICDGADNDCDSVIPAEEADGDGDGVRICEADCDDTDDSVYPGAAEIPCDEIDQNCNGLDDDMTDADGDGHDSCSDCDDGDAASYPGAEEVCDGADNDCDSVVPADEVDGDGDGVLVCESDCDDADSSIYPGAAEITCDGIDQNCNGLDDDAQDGDEDGYSECDDCDDSNAAINPGASEVCGDGADNDCDGLIDDADRTDCGTAGSRTICSVLGDDPSGADVDQDVFVFAGTAGEQVSLNLDPVSPPPSPGRATLILVNTTSARGILIGSDRTSLPNQLAVTLPNDGEYRLAIHEEPNVSLLSGRRFSGEYCLTLDSDQGAAQSLQPTSSVEGLAAAITERKTTRAPSREATSGRTRSR